MSVTIQRFKLTANINGTKYTAYAKGGEIRIGEVTDWDNKTVLAEGQEVENLFPAHDSLITLESKESREGWLQFDIDDVGYDEPEELSATLTAIDAKDGEHPVECKLKYTSER